MPAVRTPTRRGQRQARPASASRRPRPQLRAIGRDRRDHRDHHNRRDHHDHTVVTAMTTVTTVTTVTTPS